MEKYVQSTFYLQKTLLLEDFLNDSIGNLQDVGEGGGFIEEKERCSNFMM
jgi:hypothetical protein